MRILLLSLLANRLDMPIAKVSDAVCADFLGIARSTSYRIRSDPDYVASSSLVAQAASMM